MTIIPLAVLLVVSGPGFAEDDAPKDQSAKFKITARRKDDRVDIRADDAKVVFVIKSPAGISQATVEREGEKWPDGVVLHLHLKGLENFRASNGKTTLDAAVSSRDGKVRIWKDGKEDAPLDEKSPFGMNIRVVGGDGKPAREIPLKDGHFEMTLPKAFFEENPRSITLKWLDFYRN